MWLEGNSSPQNTINVVWQWLQTYKCNVKNLHRMEQFVSFCIQIKKAVILNVTLMPLMPWLLEKQLE